MPEERGFLLFAQGTCRGLNQVNEEAGDEKERKGAQRAEEMCVHGVG